MTRQLDVLIVAPSAADLYQDLKEDFAAKEPNIWAGLLANAVRAKGFGVAIYDMEIERPSVDEFLEVIESCNPRLVLFTVTGQWGCIRSFGSS